MIVFYKNFNRTERTILSIQSVRYLFPSIKIYCLNLYVNDVSEYNSYLKSFKELNVKVFFEKKRYNFNSSGAGSKNNGFYFTEGINKMFKLTENENKVLMLDEDSFFTTGSTIKFLQENNFDLAYGIWPSPIPNGFEQINASILCVNCSKLKSLFPIIEQEEFVENLLGRELHDKCVKKGFKTLQIPTRNYIDYGGDGVHTNDVEIIKKHLTLANIPFNI